MGLKGYQVAYVNGDTGDKTILYSIYFFRKTSSRRAEVLANAVRLIQRRIKTHLMRKEFIKLRKASIKSQKFWRGDLENTYMGPDYSGKMILLLDILSKSSELGDKLQIKGKEGKHWKRGKDWYRLDGSTPSSDRQNLVEMFNDPENARVKCTLISTRAGSLGINLHAANRVVLLDGSWNPTHNLQAIYQVWRPRSFLADSMTARTSLQFELRCG
ncbi:hypothetical protein SETIT_5G216200v2 [Setaria italica]|uniref:Helicase C-terminal domain-containing protein n=1 Tax=Setaria italica TaxID=4555 RepID=K3XS86_SETIT|nr:hypothetical protein SETIT_5G216200v2 [Setaria italica]